MTLTSAVVQYAISATGTPTRTNISGGASIGETLQRISFPTADIAYSFSIVATGSSDVATLTLSTGQVVQTTGTPTLADEGVDQEGKTLPTAVRVYAILIECVSEQVCAISGTFSHTHSDELEIAGERLFYISSVGHTSLGTIIFTFGESGGEHKVTVIGKTS